jgi:hypothetical protein
MTPSTTDLETDALSAELFEKYRDSMAEILSKCTSGKQMYEVGGISLANLITCFVACTTTNPNNHPEILRQLIEGAELLLQDTDIQAERLKTLN